MPLVSISDRRLKGIKNSWFPCRAAISELPLSTSRRVKPKVSRRCRRLLPAVRNIELLVPGATKLVIVVRKYYFATIQLSIVRNFVTAVSDMAQAVRQREYAMSQSCNKFVLASLPD